MKEQRTSTYLLYFFVFFFTISVYHKFKCLCTFALIGLMILSYDYRASVASFISAVTLMCDNSINYKIDLIVWNMIQEVILSWPATVYAVTGLNIRLLDTKFHSK